MHIVARRIFSVIEGTLPGLLLLGIVLLVGADVLMRYAFGHPLSITSETAMIGIVWIIMLGSARAARKYQHIAITMLADRLDARMRAWHALLITLAVIGVLAVVFATAVPYVFATAGRILPLSELPRWVLTAAVPVGIALMLVHYVEDVVVTIGDIARGTTRYLDRYTYETSLILDPTTPDTTSTGTVTR